METNLNKVASDLYGKIQTRFSDIKLGDEDAEVITNKHDVPLARFFEFDYNEGGKAIGTVTITLDQDDGIVILVSGELVDDSNSIKPRSAYRFIRSLRQFAKNHLLKFDIQNTGKSNLNKRDYQFKTKSKRIMESRMYGSAKISYQDLGETRIVIRHKSPVNEDSPLGRSQNIDSIYIENKQGERFRYPRNHLTGARALAEHIGHGGNPYDSIGKHIIGLSEELSHLRKFKNFVNRQPMIAEAMNDVNQKVIERIESVKKELTRLQRSSYYEQFAESFKEEITSEIPQSVVEDWTNRLTIRSFNEELSSVFPYLYRIIDESDIPVRELGPEDLLAEDQISDNDNTIFNPNPQIRHVAIKHLEKLMSEPLIAGPNGTTAINALSPLLDDGPFTDELKDELQNTDENFDVRALVQNYIIKLEDYNILPYDAVADIIELDLDYEIQDHSVQEPPAPEPESPPPPEEPPPETEQPEEPVAPESGETVPEEEPVAEEKYQFSSRPKFAQKLSRRRSMSRALTRARKSGALLETQLDFGYRVMTIREAIEECGFSLDEVGYSDLEHSYKTGEDEVREFIEGYYNETEGNLVRGFTNFEQKLLNARDEGKFPNATNEDIESALEFARKIESDNNPHEHELTRMRDLAGVDPRGERLEKLIQSFKEPVSETNSLAMMKSIMEKLNCGN